MKVKKVVLNLISHRSSLFFFVCLCVCQCMSRPNNHTNHSREAEQIVMAGGDEAGEEGRGTGPVPQVKREGVRGGAVEGEAGGEDGGSGGRGGVQVKDAGRHLLAGALARGVACTILFPLDTVKSRLQFQRPHLTSVRRVYRGALDVTRWVVKFLFFFFFFFRIC